MEVWMAASSRGNPYIDLLVEHLRERGLGVRDGVEPQGTILREALREQPPDVLHLHWLNVFFLRDGIESLEVARSAGLTAGFLSMLSVLEAADTGLVWTAHNLHNHEREMWLADEVCHGTVARAADAILAHSESARRRVIEEFDLRAGEKVRVVPHGNYIDVYPDAATESEAREQLGLGPEERVLLHLGRIRPYKNVPKLIRSFLDVAEGAGERLVVAGSVDDDFLRTEIECAARRSDSVDLHLGFVDDADLQYYLKASDAVVLPYREILTSGTAVLAMSFGRPVVAPRRGTLRDVVDEEGGFLYDPSDAEGLAHAIRGVLDADPGPLREMGEHSLEQAKRWDWETVAAETAAVYEEVEGGK